MSNGGKKPIKLDLVACYSGFSTEELQYIDYTRTIMEEEEEEEFKQSKSTEQICEGIDNDEDDDQDELLPEDIDYDEVSHFTSVEELSSYLCSTPSLRRRRITQTMSNLSEISEVEYGRDCARMMSSQCTSRTNSVISLLDERGPFPDSLEGLLLPEQNELDESEGIRKKIEFDWDIKNPYSAGVDDLDISIDDGDYSENPGAFGTLKRRMSLKGLRRNISTGFFGSFRSQRQNQAQTLHLVTRESRDIPRTPLSPRSNANSSAQAQQGLLNLWFKKFRNRHFI